jgi:hypothetical protein
MKPTLDREQNREKLLVPTLLFKDQLEQLEKIASETSWAPAHLVRVAVDQFLAQQRSA